MRDRVERWRPDWSRGYGAADATGDAGAAVIVTIMLVPQSLAYAMLAGLPPATGLYASMLPLLGYAAFGSSRALAVGPVAVVSLMTAAAIGPLGLPPGEAAAAAGLLALLVGALLFAAGVLRLGFFADLLSHPVVAGFVAASALLIAAGQLRHLLGAPVEGGTLPELAASLWHVWPQTHGLTLALGLAGLALLIGLRRWTEPLARRLGAPAGLAAALGRMGPAVAVVAATAASVALGLAARGVAVVGEVPAGLPPLALPPMDAALARELAGAAALFALVGFVESVSVARTLAARRGERIDADRELLGLGAANLSSGVSGGFPVTGGFARSVVNFDAGARSPLAGVGAAAGLALVAMAAAPLLAPMPRAILAATVIVAVAQLVDLHPLQRARAYARGDFAAGLATLLLTLGFGVEAGLAAGTALAVLLHLQRAARPHVAEVGRVPGTEHFRNVLRHRVETRPGLLTLRIDESLFFANARRMVEMVERRAGEADARDVVLMCSAVNEIDLSALEALEELVRRLDLHGVRLHLSEVKGPVEDRLRRTGFLDALTGRVFLSQDAAFRALAEPSAPVRITAPGSAPKGRARAVGRSG
jgi:SulP family sulfate permease